MTRLVDIEGLVKDYPGVRALDDVDFTLESGEVHALLGHNGAGKSTLVKIVAGDQKGEARRFAVCGHDGVFESPQEAIRVGVRIVTQERALVATLSVEENLLLGSLPAGRAGRVRWGAVRARARELLAELGVDVDPAELLGRLRPPEQTLVEIAKVLAEQARVIVLDEPTATLSEHESERLFEIVRGLTARGVGVVLVSHRVPDIFALADRATVLRDGRVVFTSALAGLEPGILINRMTGEDTTDLRLAARARRDGSGEKALEVRGLTVAGAVEDVSFHIARGEIVGAFGLVGSGATELPAIVFGGVRHTGSVVVEGGKVGSAREAARRRIGLVPADRADGVLLEQSVARNLGAANLVAFRRRGVFSRRRELAAARRWIEKLDVRPPLPQALAATLSGGNQQKTLLGRWLERGVSVLLLAEPTRGVDVGTRAAIHAILEELRAAGAGILVASSDLDEVVSVADRVLVFSRNRIVAELPGGLAAREGVLHAAAG